MTRSTSDFTTGPFLADFLDGDSLKFPAMLDLTAAVAGRFFFAGLEVFESFSGGDSNALDDAPLAGEAKDEFAIGILIAL